MSTCEFAGEGQQKISKFRRLCEHGDDLLAFFVPFLLCLRCGTEKRCLHPVRHPSPVLIKGVTVVVLMGTIVRLKHDAGDSFR